MAIKVQKQVDIIQRVSRIARKKQTGNDEKENVQERVHQRQQEQNETPRNLARAAGVMLRIPTHFRSRSSWLLPFNTAACPPESIPNLSSASHESNELLTFAVCKRIADSQSWGVQGWWVCSRRCKRRGVIRGETGADCRIILHLKPSK